jgi:hypothetical protein
MALSQKYSYYEILEITPYAEAYEVTSAYNKVKQIYSGLDPSIYTIFSETEAKELQRMIEEAYAVLGNRQLRSRYDLKVAKRDFKDESELSYASLVSEASGQITSPITRQAGNLKIKPELEEKFKERTDWDGAALKEVREFKMLSLKDLHSITKVNSFYINGIENMNSSELPAEVFVRGYVHQISKALGLNDKVVVDSYMKKFKSLLNPNAQK